MATRLLFQLVFFLLPFMLFGIYRIAIAEAEQEGRKPWPIRWLFGIGLVLAVGSWFALILFDRGGEDQCYRAAYADPETGNIVPGAYYQCERDLTKIGMPRSDDPGARPAGADEDGGKDRVNAPQR